MPHEIDAILLDETKLSLDELARICQVSHEWIIERAQLGLLRDEGLIDIDPSLWLFDSRSFTRAKRIIGIERDYECNPELAALVTDMIEEIELLRSRLKAAGLDED